MNGKRQRTTHMKIIGIIAVIMLEYSNADARSAEQKKTGSITN